VQKLFGFLVLTVAFMIGIGTVGCNKKTPTSSSKAADKASDSTMPPKADDAKPKADDAKPKADTTTPPKDNGVPAPKK